jgi:PKD repeat protein
MNSVLAQMSGRAAAIALAVSVAACSVDGQNAPPLTGPSGFGQTVTLSASPDQLPRDGASRSTVTISVRNEVHQPVAGQRLAVSANAGTISASDVVTDSSGNAVVTVTAPPSSTVVASSGMSISATPVGTDRAPTSAPRSISIALTGVRNTTAPAPAFTVNPGDPNLLQTVVLDASGTQDEGAPCTDDVCTYTWDFGGEAQATGRVVTYQFRAVRTYPVKLTVQDAAGTISTLTQNVTVAEGAAPTASFVFSPTAPAILEQVNFSADASAVGVPGRTIASYEWQFGDGTTDTGRNVAKAFPAAGVYVVSLTVTDNAGLRATATQTVTVTDGISAAFSFSPTDPRANGNVVFNASTSRAGRGASIATYAWNFGDSTTVTPSSSPVTSHVFTAAGTYTVVLTVTDTAGRSATTSLTVTVAP